MWYSLNTNGTDRLIENLIFVLSKFDCWHEAQVSMTASVFRKTSNSEEQLLSGKKEKEIFKTLRDLRRKHPKNVFLGHLNGNSLRIKFESLNELIKDTFDIFLVTESKLDSSFPDSQFSIPGCCIAWKDQNRNGGGILFYINEDIPFKVIKSKQLPGNLEILKLEIILDKMKILLMELYKPPSFNEKHFLFDLNNAYNFFCTTFQNITLIGKFTIIPENKKLKDFYEMNKIWTFDLETYLFYGSITLYNRSTID